MLSIGWTFVIFSRCFFVSGWLTRSWLSGARSRSRWRHAEERGVASGVEAALKIMRGEISLLNPKRSSGALGHLWRKSTDEPSDRDTGDVKPKARYGCRRANR